MAIPSGAADPASEAAPVTGSTGRFSCVVDRPPRFHVEALRWFASLTEVAGVVPGDLVVHVIGTDESAPLDHLRSCGVTVRGVEPFDPRSPHCNKIAGALRLAAEPVEGMAVLCDTDIVILEDPRGQAVPADSVGAKPVDAPVPPVDVLVDVFSAAGLELPPTVPLPWGPGKTVRGNSNGGLYLVPGPLLPRLAGAWARWARWLLDRTELLDRWGVHVDQVSLSLAAAEEGVGWEPLDVRWNTPTHDRSRIPEDAAAPAILHYHQETDGEGRIRSTGIGAVDAQIEVANRALEAVWSRALPGTTHREWRDASLPQLGEDDEGFPAVLGRLLDLLGPDSVLEIGLGGPDVVGDRPLARYVGIDESAEVLDRAGRRRPNGQFLVGTVAEHPVRADVTICLGELLRPSDATDYRNLLASLWASADVCLVVAGFEAAPAVGVPGRHFHEPLSATLERIAPGAELYLLGDDRGAPVLGVLRSPAERHPRDYPASSVAPLIDRHPDPVLLIALRLHARRTTGFYPDHAPRLWEYPVVARLVMDELPEGSRLVDVGAGVTPLPPFLADHGYVIDTVDPSSNVRAWDGQSDWNEWGYLDYAAAGLAHRSWNRTLDALPVRPPFDGVYSVSVIEHLPAADRRSLLADMAARTRDDGLVVLTIDLVRGSSVLWNRNLGVQVEDPAVHGTLADVIDETAAVDLRLFRQETVRSWGDVDVDIGLLALRKASAPAPAGRRPGPGRWRALLPRRRL